MNMFNGPKIIDTYNAITVARPEDLARYFGVPEDMAQQGAGRAYRKLCAHCLPRLNLQRREGCWVLYCGDVPVERHVFAKRK